MLCPRVLSQNTSVRPSAARAAVEVASKVIGVMDEWIMSCNKIIPRGITLVCFAQMTSLPSTLVAKSGFTTLVKKKRHCPSIRTTRAGLKGRGARGNFYWRVHVT